MTEEHKERIQRDYCTVGPAQLSRELGIPISRITAFANSRGLRVVPEIKKARIAQCNGQRGFNWKHSSITEEQKQTIINNYKELGPTQLAKQLGTTVAVVAQFANRRGLYFRGPMNERKVSPTEHIGVMHD